jgi:hypothetical protein
MGDGYSNLSDIIGNNNGPVQQFPSSAGLDPGLYQEPQQQAPQHYTTPSYGGGFHFTKKLL